MSDWVFRFGTQCVPKFTRFFSIQDALRLEFPDEE